MFKSIVDKMISPKQLGTLRQKVKQKKSFTKVKTNNNLQTYHRVQEEVHSPRAHQLCCELGKTDGNYILLLLSISSDLCAVVPS